MALACHLRTCEIPLRGTGRPAEEDTCPRQLREDESPVWDADPGGQDDAALSGRILWQRRASQPSTAGQDGSGTSSPPGETGRQLRNIFFSS